MKKTFEFLQHQKSCEAWGNLQQQAFRAHQEFLASGKDFRLIYEEIKVSKHYAQLRGVKQLMI